MATKRARKRGNDPDLRRQVVAELVRRNAEQAPIPRPLLRPDASGSKETLRSYVRPSVSKTPSPMVTQPATRPTPTAAPTKTVTRQNAGPIQTRPTRR